MNFPRLTLSEGDTASAAREGRRMATLCDHGRVIVPSSRGVSTNLPDSHCSVHPPGRHSTPWIRSDRQGEAS